MWETALDGILTLAENHVWFLFEESEEIREMGWELALNEFKPTGVNKLPVMLWSSIFLKFLC